MYRIKQAFDIVKNIQKPKLRLDFRLNPLALLLLALFLSAGLFWQYRVAPPGETLDLLRLVGGTVFAGLLLLALPLWGLVVALIVLFWVGLLAKLSLYYAPLLIPISLGLLLAPCLQIAHHWEKAVIQRLGKFRTVKGPGVFLLFPLIDRIASYVDTRIRATDFSAEKAITVDTVPVHVDALAFWMIWDARKAILEVQNFLEAVVLSAQTALRDAIGKYDLAELLSERDRIGREIQQVLDRKTNPWGITILSIEFTDIIIPKELEDAMSKRAQAERERQSRVILGLAEVEVSDKFVEAAERYQDNPTALHLRAMNMIYEGIKKHGTIVLLPSGALSSMSLSGILDDLAAGRKPAGFRVREGGPGAEQKEPSSGEEGDEKQAEKESEDGQG